MSTLLHTPLFSATPRAARWRVPHPFAECAWPPSTEQLNARVVLFLDDLDADSSTWAYLPPQPGAPEAQSAQRGKARTCPASEEVLI